MNLPIQRLRPPQTNASGRISHQKSDRPFYDVTIVDRNDALLHLYFDLFRLRFLSFGKRNYKNAILADRVNFVIAHG
jgi:hypothetical protein